MPRTHLFAHLLPPIVITVAGLVMGLRIQPLTGLALVAYLLGAGLFYAGPHILWAALVLYLKPRPIVIHAGFVACTSSLLAISGLLFVSRDPSGLPYQWLLYWPLAGALLVLLLLLWLVSGRPRAEA